MKRIMFILGVSIIMALLTVTAALAVVARSVSASRYI